MIKNISFTKGKRSWAILCVGLLLAGCAKIEFEDALGNKARYSRVGSTKMQNVEYENKGVILRVGSVDADSGKLGDALINATNALDKIAETALNASKVVAPIP